MTTESRTAVGATDHLRQHRRDYAFTSDDPRQQTFDEPFFSGALSFCRRPYARSLAKADVAVMGVPFDTAVSNRPGTRFGPRAVRAASTNLAWARCWPSAFDPFERLRVVDWGDIVFDYGHPEQVPAQIEAAITSVIGTAAKPGIKTLLIGGDHFTTYPSLRAHAARYGQGLSLIHFDAHSDTWEDDGERIDHGTMFRVAVNQGIIDDHRSIQVGLRTTNDSPMGFTILDANKVHRMTPEAVAAEVRRVVGNRPAYLTFDIDCLDPAFAPGTGTPVCGGLSTWFARECLRNLAGMNIVGADVVEVSPAYDVGEITALAGATLALDMLCLFAECPVG